MTGNKGEWSELYAFLYTLINGEIVEKDGTVNVVTKMARFECGKEKEYTWEDGYIKIPKGQLQLFSEPVNPADLRLLLPDMFSEIKNGTGSYSCPTIEKVMKVLDIERIKSASSNKDDFKIQFRGSKLRGFNVKSELGNCAGIINASKKTNFFYQVFSSLSDSDVNALRGPKDRIRTIYDNGGHLEFRDCHESYKMQLGQEATQIFSMLLLEYFKSDEKMIPKLVDQIFGSKKRVLNLPKEIWINTISRILTDSGDFIRPSKIRMRDARSASGGLIFVKRNGTVTCDIYSSKDDAGDYLYKTAFLDTASTTRHDFGKVYLEPDKGYRAIKLNLNIKGTN
jgi:type II restriction enzyme